MNYIIYLDKSPKSTPRKRKSTQEKVKKPKKKKTFPGELIFLISYYTTY